jgi:hypothetical protein
MSVSRGIAQLRYNDDIIVEETNGKVGIEGRYSEPTSRWILSSRVARIPSDWKL